MGEDERVRDDAAAWLLGALSEEEARDFERLLETSAAAREEVEELRRAADALPFAAEPIGPPPELRERIMAIVESEAEVLRASGASADRAPARPRRWPRQWVLRPVPLAAAACALVLAGVGAGLLIAGAGSEPARTVAAEIIAPGMEGARARLEIADGRAELIVDGMRPAGPRRVYQVWVLHRGQSEAVPAGALFDVDRNGHGTAALASVENVEVVMVSLEPEGGSERPSRDPVLSATLS